MLEKEQQVKQCKVKSEKLVDSGDLHGSLESTGLLGLLMLISTAWKIQLTKTDKQNLLYHIIHIMYILETSILGELYKN